MIAIRQRTDDEALKLLVDVLDVVSIGVEQYKAGRTAAWLIVSNRLHQLLQDETPKKKGKKGQPDEKGVPLALRVFTTIELHPLSRTINLRAMNDMGIKVQLDVQPLFFGGGSVQVMEIFDITQPRLSLIDWLAQVIAVKDEVPITLDDIIKMLRHKSGGVHFDKNVNPTEHRIETLLTIVSQGREHQVYTDYIVLIGEYVYAQLKAQLDALPQPRGDKGSY